MRVRLTTDRVAGGAFQQEGELLDLPAEEARRLIECGQAENAEPTPVSKPQPKRRDNNR